MSQNTHRCRDTSMKFAPILAHSTHALLLDDGNTVPLDMLAELLVIELKGHGHFGNIVHHVSSGDWAAVHHALRELFQLPGAARMLSPLAMNIVRMLGSPTRNLSPFRPWLLQRVERQSTDLYRRSFERRLDMLIEETEALEVRFTKSAFRILADRG